MAERIAAPAVAEGEVVASVEVEPILDPPGQCVEIDGRVLSERLMFSFGFGGCTYQEIAEEFAASVLWVEVAVRQNPWLEEARVAGTLARDRDRVIRSLRSADKLVDGYKIKKQKHNKITGEIDTLEEEVGPSAPMITKVLEARAPSMYGKAAVEVTVNVGMDALAGALERAAQAGFREVP